MHRANAAADSGDRADVQWADARAQGLLARAKQIASCALERLAVPHVQVGPWSLPAFGLCGGAGLLAAAALALGLAACTGIALWVVPAAFAVGLSAFLGGALLVKVVHGAERLTYYRDALTALTAIAALIWIAGLPLLPSLDIAVLSVGLVGAFGRIGCLMVGCCHGAPASWGVRYRAQHAAAGFPHYYVGVHLLPVQAIESMWQFVAVAIGTALVLDAQEPGTALVWYTAAYASGRFFLELRRGDALRRFHAGLSSAQWTSVVLVCTVAALGWNELLPGHWWAQLAAGGLLLAGLVLVLSAPKAVRQGLVLLRADHIAEVAAGVAQLLGQSAPGPHMTCTSLGLKLSMGTIHVATGPVLHFALSSQARRVGAPVAAQLADLIGRVCGVSGELVRGNGGVFHLLLPARSSNGAQSRSLASGRARE